MTQPVRILGVVLLIAAVGAGTFLIGRWSAPLNSGERAAQSARSDVLIPAESRYIQDRTRVTGFVRSGHSTTINLVQPPGTARSVITAAPSQVGATIHSGDVVVAVSGRPVIAVDGSTPTYRDIAKGDSGPDVTQLQSALRELGYHPDSNGTVGADTERAIERLYESHGYPPPTGGIIAPAAEFMFAPGLPGTLAAAPAAVGTAADGQTVTIDTGGTVVAVSATSAATVPTGSTVQLTCLGHVLRGTAEQAIPAPTGSGNTDAGPGESFEVPVDVTTSVGRELIGVTCLGSVTTRKTDGKVLAVPVTAVFDASGGGSVVRINSHDGPQTLRVTTGASGDGWIEIIDPPAGLAVGTKVLVSAVG